MLVEVKERVMYPNTKRERNQEMLTLIKEGHTYQEVGTRYGITRERVRQIAHRAGVYSIRSYNRPPLPEAELKALYLSGLSTIEIAAIFKCKRSWVVRHLRLYDIHRPKNLKWSITVDGKPMLVHRYLMEQALGRALAPEEVVHHINENKRDNRLENLMLFPNNTEHLNYHRAKLGNWNRNTRGSETDTRERYSDGRVNFIAESRKKFLEEK